MTDLLTLENTAIVMDSTCDPPDGWFDQPGLYMVPLKVHFGDQMFRDGVDMTYKEFFAKLEASDVLPTTSQPTAGEFVAAYEEALKQYEHVFSLHISGEMSGTVRAAEQAAEQFDNVYVYDLRTVTSALALGAERLRARLAARLHARRGARLRGALPRRVARRSSTPRPSSTCVAAAASGAPRRSSAACSTSSRSSPPSTARSPATPRCAATRRPWPRCSGSSRSAASPTTSFWFCTIDAVNDDEPHADPRARSRASGPTPTTPSRATWRRSSAPTSAPARRPSR